MADEGNQLSNKWISVIPWFITIASTCALIAIGYFLIENIQWYKESVFNDSIKDVNEGAYRIRAYDLHLSMIKRSVGLFSGFAIMFIGLGVSFFTLKKNTEMELKSQIWSVNLVTASPGILAVLVGGFLIISTIKSKDSFGSYEPGSQTPGYYKYPNSDPTKTKKDTTFKLVDPAPKVKWK